MKIKTTCLFFCVVFNYFSQDYKLISDSCFYVFIEKTDDFGQNNYVTVKGVNPNNDTLVNGINYIKVINSEIYEPYAAREEGNKIYGLVKDSINEMLLLDLDIPIHDTMYNLYAQGYYYHAYVFHVDSVFSTHNWKNFYIRAFAILNGNNWENHSWEFMVRERTFPNSICFFNIPEFYIGNYNIINVEVCSTDPMIVQEHNLGYCELCEPKINYASLNEKKLSVLKLYPNPSSDMLTIELIGNNAVKNIHIYDVLGHELLEQVSSFDKTTLQLDQLKAGIYFVEIESEGEKFRASFVKE